MKFVSSAHLVGGGTITGDLTISGDLTVTGGGGFHYTEVISASDSGASYTQYVNSSTGTGAGDGTLIGLGATEETVIWNQENTHMVFATNNAEKMRIGADGQVTITTAATDEKLSLKGSNTPYIRWYENTTAKAFIQWHTDGYLQFTNEEHSENFYLADNGVGIGTSAPDGKLSVRTAAAQNSVYLDTYSDTTDHLNALYFRKSANDTAGTRTATADGDIIALLEFQGVDSAGNWDDGAFIRVSQTGSIGSRVPTKMEFATFSNSAEKIPFIIDANSRISLSNNDGGAYNTIFGSGAGNSSIDSGAGFNVIIGDSAAKDGAKAAGYDNNTIIGYSAGEDGTSHADCVAVGFKAMETHNGSRNIAIGSAAMAITNHNNDTAGSSDNVFIGYQSGGGTWANNDSNFNVGVGALSLKGAMDGAVNNTAMGYASGYVLTSGAHNTLIGYYSGLALAGGSSNTSIGKDSSKALTDGHNNVAIGNNALETSTSVGYVVAIGDDAMKSGDATSAADGTIAIGGSALMELTSGAENVAIGYQALQDMTTGSSNVAVGYQSQKDLNHADADCNVTVGNYTMDGAGAVAVHSCTAVGHNALSGSLTATANNATAVGRAALKSLTSGAQNTAVGANCADDLTTGGYNTAVGKSSLASLTTGSNNVTLGRTALSAAADDESDNVVIGYGAMEGAKQDGTVSSTNREVKQNIAIGSGALYGGTLTSTSHLESCIAIGHQALDATGANNQIGTIAIGTSALGALTSGAGNLAIGHLAGSNITTGTYNLAIGRGVLLHCVDGTGNIGIGYGAMADWDVGGSTNTTVDGSNNNIMIGVDAGGGAWTNVQSNYNVGIGNYVMDAAMDGALYNTAVGYNSSSSITTGDSNSTFGLDSGRNINSGEKNSCFGHEAGNVITTGTNNTIIGQGSDPSANNGTNQSVIGYTATGVADNSVTLGNASVTAVYMAQDATSDYTTNTEGATVYAGGMHLKKAGVAYNSGGVTSPLVVHNSFNDSPNNGQGVGIDFVQSAEDTDNGAVMARIGSRSSSGLIGSGGSGFGADLEFSTIADGTLTKVMSVVGGDDKQIVELHTGGIKFPATQVASGDANVLDDYEEGNFTVTVSGDASGAFSAEEGEYVKIGKVVHFRIVINVSSNFAANTIAGLPFACTQAASPSGLVGGIAVLTSNANDEPITASVLTGGSTLQFFSGSDATDTHLPNTTNDVYRLEGTYFAA